MPTIKDSSLSSYVCAPTSALGLVPNAVSEDAVSLREGEQSTFEHLSQSLESATELFAALTALSLSIPNVPPPIFNAHMEALEKLYEFNQTNELNDFMHEHYELAAGLFAVHQGLKNYFPGKFSLELLPAGEDSSLPQLVLYAHSHLNARDARKALTDFRQEWWRKNYLSCFKRLTVSVAFECQ